MAELKINFIAKCSNYFLNQNIYNLAILGKHISNSAWVILPDLNSKDVFSSFVNDYPQHFLWLYVIILTIHSANSAMNPFFKFGWERSQCSHHTCIVEWYYSIDTSIPLRKVWLLNITKNYCQNERMLLLQTYNYFKKLFLSQVWIIIEKVDLKLKYGNLNCGMLLSLFNSILVV